jgi:tripartite-type tricarboxylate transporter receptor subunit TctC
MPAPSGPEKPIKIIVPWPAGGGSDVVARQIAGPLGDQLKQSVVIENRPGANGAIGSEVVARSQPDGYTLVWVTADTHAMNPHVYPKLAYDPRSDFTAVGIVGYFPYALVVNPSFPANNVAEFVAEAKKRRERSRSRRGASAGPRTSRWKCSAPRPIRCAARALSRRGAGGRAVMGGQVDSMIVPMSVASAQAAGGKLKLLGLASPKRFAGAPDLKTFAEQGVPIDAGTWVGLMAPAKTPPDVVKRLNDALTAVVANPQVREQLIKMNVDPAGAQTPPQFQAFVASEYDRWGKTIKDAKIKAE